MMEQILLSRARLDEIGFACRYAASFLRGCNPEALVLIALYVDLQGVNREDFLLNLIERHQSGTLVVQDGEDDDDGMPRRPTLCVHGFIFKPNHPARSGVDILYRAISNSF